MVASERVVLVGQTTRSMDAFKDALTGGGFEVVGTAPPTKEALSLLAREQAAIAVIDLALGAAALECLREVRSRYPHVAVVTVSSPGDEASINTALAEGAAACVLRSGDPADLVTAVRQARRRSVFFATSPTRRTPSSEVTVVLTERELEILRLVMEGSSNVEIARRLWVTDHTVKFHLSKIYRKLGVSNRTEASRFAEAHGLVDQVRVSRGR